MSMTSFMIPENMSQDVYKRQDWHHIFSEAAFERFKIDTFAGKKYLQYAIDGWEWLSDKYPGNKQYQNQYEICRKMYQRCYPE